LHFPIDDGRNKEPNDVKSAKAAETGESWAREGEICAVNRAVKNQLHGGLSHDTPRLPYL
jgi:hypothetical protein